MVDEKEIKRQFEIVVQHVAPDTDKDGYPPPAPPVGRKSDIFNVADFLDIDRRAAEAPEELASSYSDLLSYLTKDATSDLQKLRAVFKWMGTRKLLGKGVYKKDLPNSTPYWFLKRIAETDSGYVQFFALLCRFAGLPCVVLEGPNKRVVGYLAGQRNPPPMSDWNAVYVDGFWRLVAPRSAFTGVTSVMSSDWMLVEDTGTALRQGVVSGVPVTSQHINEAFFLPEPDVLIYFQRPDDDAWQLLAEPWSMKKFLDTPLFTWLYMESDFKLADNIHAIVEAPDGRSCITFERVPESAGTVCYKLFFNQRLSKNRLPDTLQLESYVLVTTNSKAQSALTRLPIAGVYILELQDSDRNRLCQVRIVATGKIGRQKRFPDIPKTGLGFNQEAVKAGLVDPSRENGMLIAHEGEKVRIKFRTLRPLQVRARLVHSTMPSEELESRVTQEEENGTVTVTVKVPYEDYNPEFSLQIDAREKDTDKEYVNVLNYLLTPDEILLYSLKGKEEQITEELTAALKDEDADRLESALTEYKRAQLTDAGLVKKAYTRLYDLHRQGVEKAESSRSLDQLNAALTSAQQSQVAYRLRHSDWFVKAEATQRKLNRLASVTHKVEKLSPRQVSEVQTYNHPHPLVLAAVTATYLLLGESPKKLKDWKYIQSLLRRHGKGSIIHQIKTKDVGSIKKDQVEKAALLLNACDSVEIKATSIGAAAFYEWSKAVVEEKLKEDNESSAAEKNTELRREKTIW